MPRIFSGIMVKDVCYWKVLACADPRPTRFPSRLLYPSCCVCTHLSGFSVCNRSAFWLRLQPLGPESTLLHRILQTFAWLCLFRALLSCECVVLQRECCACNLRWWLRGTFCHCFGIEGRIFCINVTVSRLIFVIYIFV